MTLESFAMNDDSVESKSGKMFDELYDLEAELGKGVFSVVQAGRHKETGDTYAIKIITKADMEEFDKQCLKQEIDILGELRHEHIVRLYDVFDEEEYIRLVLEKVDGGELLDRLIAKTKYTEKEARDVCKIVMDAMKHCHEHKIAHRDLKPENLLLTSPTDDSSIKVADFGFAKRCPEDNSLKTQCGSAQHVAPEILRNLPYGTKVDCWALGVIHFTLIGGYPPFYTSSNQETFKRILKADVVFDNQYWGHVSQDCKDMISGLLTLNPKERWSAAQVLDCNWMRDDADELDRTSLHTNQQKLREFNAQQKLKAAVYAVIGLNRLQYNGELAAIDEKEEPEEEPDEEPEPPTEEPKEPEPPAEEQKEPEPPAEEPNEPEPPAEEPNEPEPEPKKEQPPKKQELDEPTVHDPSSVTTRDVYFAYNIFECMDDPYNRDYFALSQKTAEFFKDVLKEEHGDALKSVDVSLRKSLYKAGLPTEEYNIYVEWDITARFAPGYSKIPRRRDLCGSLVSASMEKYLLDYVRPLEDTAFANAMNVFSGHFAC